MGSRSAARGRDQRRDMAPWSKAAVVLSLATCIECFMVPSAVIARPRALALRAPASLRLYMRHSSPEEKKKKEKTSSWITMRRSLVQAATLQLVNVLSCAAAMTDEMPPEMVEAAKQGKMTFEPRGITAQDTVVFVIGFIPFIWATNEFWRRIVAGESFGTGASSVIIDPNAEVRVPFSGQECTRTRRDECGILALCVRRHHRGTGRLHSFPGVE